jgi:hypothetical protein
MDEAPNPSHKNAFGGLNLFLRLGVFFRKGNWIV